MFRRKVKAIAGTIAAALLALAGYTAVPEQRVYERVPLSPEIKTELTERDWNAVSIPQEGTIVTSESWLLPDRTVNVTPTKSATEFHVKQIAFRDADGIFKPIDTTPVPAASGWEVTKGPFIARLPATSGGAVEMVNNNRFDTRTLRDISEPEISETTQALGTANIPGVVQMIDYGRGPTTAVVYAGAYPAWNADLILAVRHGKVPRLEKIVRFNTAIPMATVEFRIGYSLSDRVFRKVAGKRTQWAKLLEIDVTGKGGIAVEIGTNTFRGFGKKEFQIWDSAKNRRPVPVTLRAEPGGFILTKHISPALIPSPAFPVYTDTVTTVYPDPDPETTTVDGRVRNSGATYATVHDAADGSAADPTSSVLSWHHSFITGTYYIDRSFFLFDTSTIPDGDTIDSAIFSWYHTATVPTYPDADSTDVVSSTPATNTNLVVGDFDQLGTTSFATKLDSSIANSAYNNWTLNASGLSNISKTGVSKFGTRHLQDLNSTAPTGENQTEWLYAENAGTGSDPKLAVTHTAAAGAAAKSGNPGFFLLLQRFIRPAYAEIHGNDY